MDTSNAQSSVAELEGLGAKRKYDLLEAMLCVWTYDAARSIRVSFTDVYRRRHPHVCTRTHIHIHAPLRFLLVTICTLLPIESASTDRHTPEL